MVAKAWEHIERIGQRAALVAGRVLVTGAGPIGLLAALLGVQRGLEVHVLDRATDGPKPELVRDLGATYHSGRPRRGRRGRRRGPRMHRASARLVFDVMAHLGARRHRLPDRRLLGRAGRWRSTPASLNRSMVLGNGVVFGSVNANRRHYEAAAEALAKADRAWLRALITRRVPLERWQEALDRRPDDVKVVVRLEEPGASDSAAEPGSAILRCFSALTLSGSSRLAGPCASSSASARRRARRRPSAPRSRRGRHPRGRPSRRRRPSCRACRRARRTPSPSRPASARDVTPVSFSSLRSASDERLHERLRRVVDGLEGAGHRRGDRRGEEDPPLAARDHVPHDVLGELDGGAHVEIDDLAAPRSRSVSVANAPPAPTPAFSAAAASGRPAARDAPVQLVDAVVGARDRPARASTLRRRRSSSGRRRDARRPPRR